MHDMMHHMMHHIMHDMVHHMMHDMMHMMHPHHIMHPVVLAATCTRALFCTQVSCACPFPTQGAYQAVAEGRLVERESLPQNTALALENFLGANVLAVSAKYTTHAFKHPRTNGTCSCTASRGLL